MKELKLKPKAPAGVFVMFKSDELQNNHEIYKGMDLATKTKLVKQKWDKLPPKAKQIYDERRRKEVLIYKQKLDGYKAALASGTLLNISKKPVHQPFIHFCQMHYNEVKNSLNDQEISTLMNEAGEKYSRQSIQAKIIKKLSKQYHEEKRQKESVSQNKRMLQEDI